MSFDGFDISDLESKFMVGVHELGHGVGATLAGIEVEFMRRTGVRTGVTRLAAEWIPDCQIPGYLVGLMCGAAAEEVYYIKVHGMTAADATARVNREDCFRTDRAIFMEHCESPAAEGLTLASARARARGLMLMYWPIIYRRGHRLMTRTQLSGSEAKV